MSRTSALAIGVFDGVHAGHRAILRRAVGEARRRGLVPAALTFDVHPSRVLSPARSVRLMQTLEQRIEAIRALGIRHVHILKFTHALAVVPPAQFVRDSLINIYGVGVVVVGRGFRFGYQRKGDVATLRRMLEPRGVRVIEMPVVRRAGGPVHSTRVREAIERGKMDLAAALLGRPPEWEGRVVRGRRLGRKRGVPTVNLRLLNELAPPAGVYAARVGARLAVCNYGVAPTVRTGDKPILEVHFLDRVAVSARPGTKMYVQLIQKIRPERRFKSIESLYRRIQKDILAARHVLASH